MANKKKNTGTKSTSNINKTYKKTKNNVREQRVSGYHKTQAGPFLSVCIVFLCLVYFGGAAMVPNILAETNTALEDPIIEEVVEEEPVKESRFLHAAPINYEDVKKQRASLLVNNYYSFDGMSTLGFVPSGSIMDVARSQVGNIGGAPYWSWYGFQSKVAWCAIFTSWCAEQCGYLSSGICPRFSAVSQGVNFFMGNGQWASGSAVPSSGMYIFFDYDQNGSCDHVGLVDYSDGSTVYCVEGNYKDSVSYTSYPVGHYSIAGYGMPNY